MSCLLIKGDDIMGFCMKVLALYSLVTLWLTVILGLYGFLFTKETGFISLLALLILYFPPALFVAIALFRKR